MSCELPIAERDTYQLTTTGLIHLLLNEIKVQRESKSYLRADSVIAIIRRPQKQDVINYFLSKGYDVKTYSDSDYVRFSWKNISSGKGTLVAGPYPYVEFHGGTCTDHDCGVIIHEDLDKKLVCEHFGIENKPFNCLKDVDDNDLAAFLIEELSYFVGFDKKGFCHITREFSDFI